MPRPREAILSRSLIRDQALALIDEDGLEALSMRRLATRLGVQAPSLYAHFSNKEAVLDAVADRLTRHVDGSGFATGWQDGLRTWANSYYAAIHLHPNAARVVAGGTRARSDDLAGTDAVQAGLLGHAWPADLAPTVAAATKLLVLGAATVTSSDSSPDAAAAAQNEEQAVFTLALDSMILGLESVHDAVALRKRRRSAGR